jgi:hypothetical protein
MILTDAARFLGDDPEALISASFACPYCLRTASTVVANLEEPSGSAALCRCEWCTAAWVVALNLEQAMRLALAPPGELALSAA